MFLVIPCLLIDINFYYLHNSITSHDGDHENLCLDYTFCLGYKKTDEHGRGLALKCLSLKL